MKKTIKNIKVLLLSLMFISLGACDDFLDLDPINTQTADTAWDTESEVNANVLGIYYKLRDVLGFRGNLLYFCYGDFCTQMFDEALWDKNVMNGIYQYTGNGEYSDWSRYYKVLLSANLAIKKIPEIDYTIFSNNEAEAEAKKNSYIGEALFLRAYTYFYMVRLWKEVPLILEPTEDAADAEYNVPLGTEDQILAQCIQDLENAAKYLSWNATNGSVATRANNGAVYALKAHIHMWLTRPNRDQIDERNFEYAIAACDSIEARGGYSLLPIEDIKTIWSVGKTSESIFELPFSVSNGEYFNKSDNSFTTLFLGYPYNTDRKDLTPIFTFGSNLLGLFSALRDSRVTYLFENFNNTSYCFTTKYSSIHYTNTDQTDWRTDDKVAIFRLADTYLLKAEALCKLGRDTESQYYLNAVRNRAGLADYTNGGDALYNAISDERSRELFLEGHRLYDWVRTGFYATKSSVYDETRYQAEGYLWPVNYSLLTDNLYTRQTPYWSDKMSN